MDASLIGTAITGISAVAAGLATGAWITGRATAHKTNTEARGIEAKLPAEVDSVVVQGAEAAVLAMQNALDAVNKERARDRARIEQLEAEREADRKRIAALESQVSQFRKQLETAEEHLTVARKTGENLTQQITTLMREQNKRK